MTPAIDRVTAVKIIHTVHRYQHKSNCTSYGTELAECLNVDPDRVFKTLVAQTNDGELLVAVIPVSTQLSLKKLAAAGEKAVELADKKRVQRTTGYVIGGVSPIGQKRDLPTFLDSSADAFATIFVSAGRRGLEIEVSPIDLARLCNARYYELSS